MSDYPRLASAILLLGLSLLTGCASPRDDARFVLVYLKTGPESANKTPEENKTIFAGHMANIHRLADAHKLIIAGPFDHPTDSTWRGIFIFDVPTLNEAHDLVSTDPGVQSQVFTPELHELRAPARLRRLPELDREQNANVPPAEPGQPPTRIRKYVMVTTPDVPRAARAIQNSPLSGSLIWSGQFPNHAGVFVLDSDNPETVRTTLGPEAAAAKCVCDAWWSSTALVKLRSE